MGKNKTLKKGDAKALTISHPNSRKAKALSKQLIKSSTRQKAKMEYAIKRNLFGEKLLWFRDNLEPAEEYTAPMLDQLFLKYLARFDEELEQISIKHSIGQRKNRQHASREDIIKMNIKRYFEEYNTCGIEMVNILNRKQLKMFKDWDGEMGFLNQFEIKRFSKSNLANYKAVHHIGISGKLENDNDERIAVSEDYRTCDEMEVSECKRTSEKMAVSEDIGSSQTNEKMDGLVTSSIKSNEIIINNLNSSVNET